MIEDNIAEKPIEIYLITKQILDNLAENQLKYGSVDDGPLNSKDSIPTNHNFEQFNKGGINYTN